VFYVTSEDQFIPLLLAIFVVGLYY